MVYGPESLTLDPTLMLRHHYRDEAPYTMDNVQRVYRELFIMTQALSFVPQQTLGTHVRACRPVSFTRTTPLLQSKHG
jgi:hypothetical protein